MIYFLYKLKTTKMWITKYSFCRDCYVFHYNSEVVALFYPIQYRIYRINIDANTTVNKTTYDSVIIYDDMVMVKHNGDLLTRRFEASDSQWFSAYLYAYHDYKSLEFRELIKS